jgi:glycine cleavage system P protein (glycine dehydrogenase) subunit 1
MLGEAGLVRLADLNHARAVELAERLDTIDGVEVLNETFFNEFTVELQRPAAEVVEAMAARDVLGGVPVSRLLPAWSEAEPLLLVAVTETNTRGHMDALVAALKESL